jgi:hypothetical protein
MDLPLRRIGRRLQEHAVEYVIIGGYGCMLQGANLMTKDVEVACRMTPENLGKLHAALADLHPVHRMVPDRCPFTEQDAARTDWKNLYLRTDWGQLDCLGEVAGVGDFDACLAGSEILDLGEFSLRLLNLDALIASKKAAGRPRDHHAVLELEVIRERRQSGRAGSHLEPQP